MTTIRTSLSTAEREEPDLKSVNIYILYSYLNKIISPCDFGLWPEHIKMMAE